MGLADEIRHRQMLAGEAAVVDNLKRLSCKGLHEYVDFGGTSFRYPADKTDEVILELCEAMKKVAQGHKGTEALLNAVNEYLESKS